MEVVIDLQLKEIATGALEEFDSDFAFRLQMEEAMAASLSNHSSSSSELPPTVQEPKSLTENNDSLLRLTLQEEELERLKVNCTDVYLCQNEMRQITTEIRRQAHDERFARDLSLIPEAEWRNTGDFFERPIGKGLREEEEPFKLYFKGLCEIIPGSAEEYVAAIGVFICNPLGREIFKIKKAKVGPRAGPELMDLKALIEGLNAALSLGITSLNIFFQHTALFNHIIGRWTVKQRIISEVITEALILLQKFESQRAVLIPRQDIQFVFQLARDAIDAHLLTSTQLGANVSTKEHCPICLEDTDHGNIFKVENCNHRFCFSCMRQHVKVKLQNGCLPCCPSEGCKTGLTVAGSLTFLTPKLAETLAQRLKEAAIPPSEKVYCPYPRCSALMARNEVGRPERGSSSNGVTREEPWMRQCLACKGLFCLLCMVPWHYGASCEQHRRSLWHIRGEDVKLEHLASQSMWRRCIRCNHMIELASGCFHVSCKCGYEFCYNCGAQWKNKKATCSCPLWVEGNILAEEDEDSDFDDDW